jgi:hypothetical protein
VPVAATVEGYTLMAAEVTLLNMSTKSGSAATLNRAHDAALPSAERLRVLLAVGGTGLAKDIRHLESRGTHHSPQK